MSETKRINDGGPAFPCSPEIYNGTGLCGMTLRDWFAGQALQHIPLLLDAHDENKAVAVIADWSYAVADAMLVARKGGAK